MSRRTQPFLILLRYLSAACLIVPPLLAGAAWTWMALFASRSASHDAYDLGERLLLGVLVAGVVGILAEFLILPVLLNDRSTGRADPDRP